MIHLKLTPAHSDQLDSTLLTKTSRAQVDTYVKLVNEHLAVLDRQCPGAGPGDRGPTIKKILATSDLELGIEALLGLRQGEGDTRG